MGKPVGPDGVETRVTEHNFQGVLHRRIPLFDNPDIIAHGCKHSFLLPFGYKKRPPPDRGDHSRFHSDCSHTSTAAHTGNGGCPEGPTCSSGLQLPKAFHLLKLRRKLSAGDSRSLCHFLKCTCFGHSLSLCCAGCIVNFFDTLVKRKFQKSFETGDCGKNRWMV